MNNEEIAIVIEINCETGVETTRRLTPQEIAQRTVDIAKAESDQIAKEFNHFFHGSLLNQHFHKPLGMPWLEQRVLIQLHHLLKFDILLVGILYKKEIIWQVKLHSRNYMEILRERMSLMILMKRKDIISCRRISLSFRPY
ncbi:MAG: hypothetical protein EBT02_00645 [Planctomycetia bacterium]|nr:hypothetical protein [Planctomycetia bacterium]